MHQLPMTRTHTWSCNKFTNDPFKEDYIDHLSTHKGTIDNASTIFMALHTVPTAMDPKVSARASRMNLCAVQINAKNRFTKRLSF